MLISQADRTAIENKYHKTNEPFDPLRRMAYHGVGYAAETGKDDAEILDGLSALRPQLSGLPHPVARAEAIRFVLENERLYVNEHDWFVGLYSLNRLARSVTFDPWQKESLEKRQAETVAAADLLNRAGAVAIWTDYDHVVPDFQALMTLGFPGLRARARAYRLQHEKDGTLTADMQAFFDGIDIEYGAIIALIDRMARFAGTRKHEKAAKIQRCLLSLRDGAPQDIYEALQLIFLYFLLSECIDSFQVRSLGNGLDRTLLPFYERDLKSGRYTEDEVRSFLAYFLLQWSAIGNYWGQPLYLGGTNPDGSTKYTALSFTILDVYDALDIYNPKIQLKIGESTPDALLDKALDMVRRKNAALVFCCEPGMIKAMTAYGATREEALDADIRGCYETGVRADETSTAEGYVNAAKAVEYVFTNGFDTRLGKKVGCESGALADLATFADFYAAFLAQWGHLIDSAMEISLDQDRFLAAVNPSSLFSATTVRALENGKDAYADGLKHNNTAVFCNAFATAVDSLMAVKRFVYEEKRVSLADMAAALTANFAGFEELRADILNDPHKYGNHDSAADRLAAELAAFFAGRMMHVPNGRGGVFKAAMHSARTFIDQGALTAATPDGRLSGALLSKNASPADGADINGATALILSALALTPSQFQESFALDLLLHPSAVAGDEGLCAMKGLLKTYMRGGGMALQCNIFNTEMLRDAQKHPEKYRNLQVRVCGWNVLWNNLSRAEQEAYIKRAEVQA